MTKTLEFIPFEKLETVWKSMETADVSPFMYYDYMAYIVRETRRNPFRAVRIACIKDADSAEILMIVALVKVRGLHPYYKMLGDIGGCDIADALYKAGMTEEEKLSCIRFFYDAMPGKLVLRRLYEKTLLYLHAPADRIVSDGTVGYADIPVFEDWDSYLKSLSGYSRHNVKRAYMRMERDGVFELDDVTFTFKTIEGGTFKMGAQKSNTTGSNYDAEAFDGEDPVHDVTLANFWMAETEVTQALWLAVMDNQWPNGYTPSAEYGQGDDFPVYFVSYADAEIFVRHLNDKLHANGQLQPHRHNNGEWF